MITKIKIIPLLKWLIISLGILALCALIWVAIYPPTSTDLADSNCNVAGLLVRGDLVTYNKLTKPVEPDTRTSVDDARDETSSDSIYASVKSAERDDKIKAILVEVDSTGGSGVAGSEIMSAFKTSKKPVIAYIRDNAQSAGYMAASGASTIFASKFSLVGGIGINASYFEQTEKNKREGIKFVELVVGKYKALFNPDRPMTEDEKQLVLRNAQDGYNAFVDMAAKNRNLKLEDVRKLADGSTFMGERALKNKLIDQIGSLDDVKDFIRDKIGEEAEVCWK